jgi:diphthine synthase
MLYLISIGLADEKDMSIRALETAKMCDHLYVEFYTMRMFTTAEKLSQLVGKPVKEIMRSDMEEHSRLILEQAKKKRVGIMVGGDALSATTHTSLLEDARKMGIPAHIIHGSSIFTGIGETGLQVYKFGKTTTLALPEENYNPTSCYDAIRDNKNLGLHTLVLLDVKSEKGKYMSVPEAAEIIMDLETEMGQGILKKDTNVIAVCRLGRKDQVIKYAQIQVLKDDRTLDSKTPAVIIVPGEMHFMEEEYLKLISK